MQARRVGKVLWLLLLLLAGTAAGEGTARPNVVILVADDLGIGDLGCYGNTTINTPYIDRLASEGVLLAHHLAAAVICTPSRASLLTARYPARYGLESAENTPLVIPHVASKLGLPLDEVTLATALSAANYTTMAVGKWHLGMNCGLFGRGCSGPRDYGFQSFYGLPFTLVETSEGSYPFWIFPLDGSDPFYQMVLAAWLVLAATHWWWRGRISLLLLALGSLLLTLCWFVHTHYRFHTRDWWQVSPWMDQYMNGLVMEDEEVVEQPVQLEGLSQRLVQRSVRFINSQAGTARPFFLYHSFAHVHTPMFTAPEMAGRSKHGRYGDNIEEMDAMVGEIMAALAHNNLDDNTIVYFLSDHGGHLEAVDPDGQRVGGHNGPFKGGKAMGASEGGLRVAGIFRWKGHLPAGVVRDTPTSLLDTLPTILHLAGLPELPQLLPHLPPRDLDGINIADLLMTGEHPQSRSLLHHCGKYIHAVRLVQKGMVYKMHMAGYKWEPGSTQCGWGHSNVCSCTDVIDYGYQPLLYDLLEDPYEDNPLPFDSQVYRQITGMLKQFVAEWRVRVPYPPSQYENVTNTMLSLWLQPFKSFW